MHFGYPQFVLGWFFCKPYDFKVIPYSQNTNSHNFSSSWLSAHKLGRSALNCESLVPTLADSLKRESVLLHWNPPGLKYIWNLIRRKMKIWNIHLWRKNVSVDWNWSCRYKIGVVLALTRAWWKNVKKKPRWQPLMKRFTCKVEIIQKLLYLEKENFHRYHNFVIMIINTMMMMFIIITIMKAFWSFIWADW